MKARIAKFITNISKNSRIFWGALFSASATYSSRLLSESLSQSMGLQDTKALALHGFVFLSVILLITYVFRILKGAVEELENAHEQQKQTLFHAYLLCDQILALQTGELEKCSSLEKLSGYFGLSIKRLQNIVDIAYRTLESEYGRAVRPESRVDFEVTFMTKSAKDGFITIPAASNKDGRKPRSMNLREQNLEIYESSKTAELYRQAYPKMIIIEDTSSDVSYIELYPSQKTRIRSSIVFPVLSTNNKLLGALVFHCDKPRFFLHQDEKYWSDLLEIFAKRVAYEILYISLSLAAAEVNTIKPNVVDISYDAETLF